jgi:hypothetical protein
MIAAAGEDPPKPATREIMALASKVEGLLERMSSAPRPEVALGPGTPLDRHAAWGRFRGAWSRARNFVMAANVEKLTQAERKAVRDGLEAARAELLALAGDEVLTASEAGLLDLALGDFSGDVGRVRAEGDPPVPTCYTPPPGPPSTRPPWERPDPESVVKGFLGRVPLLHALARQGKIRPEVLELGLKSVEDNLAEIAGIPDEAVAKTIGGDPEVPELRQLAREALEKIKAKK